MEASTPLADRLVGVAGLGVVAGVLLLPGAEAGAAPVAAIELVVLSALLLPFLVGLAGRVAQAAARNEVASTLVVAAAAVAVAVKVSTAGAGWVARDADPALAEVLDRVNEVGFIAFLPPLGIALIALGAGVLQHGGLPRWLGWTALPVGVSLVANGLMLDAEFGPALLLFFLWTVTCGVTLVLRPGAGR